MLKVFSVFVIFVVITQFAWCEGGLAKTPRNRRQTAKDCPNSSVKFYLYTKDYPSGQRIIINDRKSLKKSNFHSEWPTRFVIHGWNNDVNSEVIQEIKDAYLKKGDFNVIAVDWNQCQWKILYYKSAVVTEFAGKIVKNFAKFLHESVNASYDDMYLIGHSLGAHVAGYAGSFLKDGKFNTIFALDPAGPEFEGKRIECRIDASDAKYVESIHTSKDLGFDEPIGIASFYPNFATFQRCIGFFCDHSMAYKYFAETINEPEKYKGVQCASYEDIQNQNCSDTGETAFMGGEPSNPKKKGLFYLSIN